MFLIDFTQLPETAPAWLDSSESMTLLMTRAAAPRLLQHELLELGWTQAAATEQRIWSGFSVGERLWQRQIAFAVDGERWMWARVLIPAASVTGPGVFLQYCGAESLGYTLFQDPQLTRQALGAEHTAEGGVMRHGLYTFYNRPLVISEYFAPALLQQEKPCLTDLPTGA